MNVRTTNYSQSIINDILYSSDYLWIAFEGSSGSTELKKVDYSDLSNEIYSKSIEVNDITALGDSTNYIYYTIDDDSYILGGALKSNPISDDTLVSIPSGITQKPVDILVSDTGYIFVLLPGDQSGTNAKILRFSYSSLTITYDLTINLTTVENAIKLVEDTSNNLWILTSNSPSEIVEVYEGSTDVYHYDKYTMDDIDNASDMVINDDYLYIVSDTNPATITKVDTFSSAIPLSNTESLDESTITGTNAKSVAYNTTFDNIYVGCEDGKVVKISDSDLTSQEELDAISESGSNSIINIDVDSAREVTYASTNNSDGVIARLDEGETNFVNSKIAFLLRTTKKLSSYVSTIFGKTISSKIAFLIRSTPAISSKICFKKAVSPSALSRTDFHVHINGSEVSDVDLASININYNESQYPTANFILGRVHDNPNVTVGGTSSEITNSNPVKIYIEDTLIFEGTISTLGFDAQEQIRVTSRGDEISTRNFKTVDIPYPSKDSHLGLYEVINHNIETQYKRTTGDNPEKYLGIKADLGTHSRDRWLVSWGMYDIHEEIQLGTWQPEPNWTYFYSFSGTNWVIGDSFTNKYVGTSPSSITDDLWDLTYARFDKQLEGGTYEYEMGYYYVGSEPYKEISPTNGAYFDSSHYEDRDDGMYVVREDGYDYSTYVREMAQVEYNKLKDISGNVTNKATTASIDITADAFLFYGIRTNTRINIDNTTEAGLFNNNSTTGFPVSVKSITIDTRTMTVNLQCNNELSEYELEQLDDTKPDENSSRFQYPGIDSLRKSKFNPDTLGAIENPFDVGNFEL